MNTDSHDDAPDDLDDPDDDTDPAPGAVWLPPETLRALMGQSRHRPARVIWNGDGPTTPHARPTATQYVAGILAEHARQNGF